jgi:hypothetical protein
MTKANAGVAAVSCIQVHGLNDVAIGGISSYTLTQTVLAHLMVGSRAAPTSDLFQVVGLCYQRCL